MVVRRLSTQKEERCVSKDLLDYTKEELIEHIRSLKKAKKFGLVWEDKPEQVAVDCATKLPVLTEVTDRAITKSDDQPTNLIIEGDNYHSLSTLNYTHAGKIDVIYIDPPYNTGAKDWKYNNNYVDSEDTFRHSKWLSFMSKRLILAKSLLKPNGVLVCAIDDNEHSHLGVLLEELFPDKEIHWVTVVHNPAGTQGKNFSYSHEYAVFVIPKGMRTIQLQDRTDNPDVRPLRDVSTGSHLRVDAKNCFYPIYIKDGEVIGFGDVSDDNFHPVSANVKRKDGVIEVYPIDASGNERKWVFARQTVERIEGELKVVKNRNRNIFDIVRTKTHFNYKTVWTDKIYNANVYGTKLLRKILPKCDFDFPKSLYTVQDCINAIVQNRPNAIVLDYFAGSGTTGHAVLELNKRDNGNRQFILCTVNENSIAEEVTYPRIKAVIEGYSDVEGISANLRYFKTSFVDRAKTNDQTRVALVARATDMIKVRENTFDTVIEQDLFKVYSGADKYSVIVFDPSAIDKAKTEIAKLTGDKAVHIYVFSLANDSFESDFADLKRLIELCPIPESILEVYKRIFNGGKTK